MMMMMMTFKAAKNNNVSMRLGVHFKEREILKQTWRRDAQPVKLCFRKL